MRPFSCWFGKHTYSTNRVFMGGNKWKNQVKCVKCGHIKEEREVIWRTTKTYKSRDVSPDS